MRTHHVGAANPNPNPIPNPNPNPDPNPNHVGAANVGWRNLALLPSLRTRVLRAMRPPHALPPTPADSPARPLRLLFTREDAGSRRLIKP